jgi:hypothetical protein
MATTKELPELVTEFVDMSKEYLRQETLGRAQLVGRHTGVALGTALVSSLAVIFLAVAGVRLLIDVMPGEPDHQMWSGLAYVIGALVLVGLAGLIAWRVGE